MVIMKRLTATLAAGATSLTFTDAAMNSNSIIEIYAVDMDVYPINQQQTGEHSVTVTFDAQMEAVNVVCLINNVINQSEPAISNLADVSLTSPENGQILTYNGTRWTNEDPSGGAEALEDLDDVDLSSPTEGQVLTFDGTKWINDDPSCGIINAYDKNNDVIIGKWYDGRNIKRHWHQWNSNWASSGKKTSPLSLADLGADIVLQVVYLDLVRKISFRAYATGMNNNDGTGTFNIWINDYFSSTGTDTALVYDYVEAE